MESPSIYAVVITFNRRRLLQENLCALQNQTYPLTGIVVIDNGSTDGTPELFSPCPSNIIYIRHQENDRPALCFCEGIRSAFSRGADWMWIMDDDVIPDRNSLKTLVESTPFSFPQTGCLSPSEYNSAGSRVSRFHKQSALTSINCREYSEKEELQGYVKILVFCWTGCLLNRKVIEAIGLPRNEVMVWHQDADYSWQVSRHFEIFGIPASKIFHKSAIPQVQQTLNLGVVRIPILNKKRLEMSFYSQRDRTHCILRSTLPFAIRWGLCLKFFLQILLGIVFFQNEKLARLRLHFAATWFGIRGVLGRSGFAWQIQQRVLQKDTNPN